MHYTCFLSKITFSFFNEFKKERNIKLESHILEGDVIICCFARRANLFLFSVGPGLFPSVLPTAKAG